VIEIVLWLMDFFVAFFLLDLFIVYFEGVLKILRPQNPLRFKDGSSSSNKLGTCWCDIHSVGTKTEGFSYHGRHAGTYIFCKFVLPYFTKK
jgi:hypothetical protein